MHGGVPAERADALATLAAATDLLTHHLKADRIRAVVRRAAANLGDRSLLELAMASDPAAVLTATRAMFSFSDAHA